MADNKQLLLPEMPGNCSYSIKSYGNALKTNKSRLNSSFSVNGIREERRVLMMAMAMIETKKLSPHERDKGKDKNTDGSANASIFNLSEDMLRQLGYQDDIHLLDPLESLPKVVEIINKAIDKWGVTPMLNFVRGGRTAFEDGFSFDAFGYKNAVATIIRVIDSDASLMTDNRRVGIYVIHQ